MRRDDSRALWDAGNSSATRTQQTPPITPHSNKVGQRQNFEDLAF
jgi:hypothetical protein